MRVDRRTFVKAVSAAGALAIFGAGYGSTIPSLFTRKGELPVFNPTEVESEGKVAHSLCLACNARCGIRVRVVNGKAVKIDGNPYHPNNTRWNPLPYNTPVRQSLTKSGVLCLKGQEGIHWVYDAYRIRVPLKRAGPRGSGEWKPIAWEQLIEEVVEGGQIFNDLGETRVVEGFRTLRSFELIDSESPELGPKANQVVLFRGRGQPGRVEFIRRWLENSFGSTNFIAHDGVCANAVQTGHKLITYEPDTGRYADQMRVDIKNARFILSFGDIYQSGQPALVPAGSILPSRMENKELKLVVVDPRAGKVVAHADKWIPIKPRTDGALLMGMIRWILENEKFDGGYLENPNKAAAEADGETTWTDATHLVVVDENHSHYRKHLRSEDIGLTDTPGKFVVIDKATNQPVLFDASDAGVLFFGGEVEDPTSGTKIKVKSSLQLLKERAFERTLDQWSQITGVPQETIGWLAKEFTSYGKRVGILMYRAPATQYNGTYMVLAAVMLQMLVGVMNWKGGYLGSASFGWTTGKYDLTKFPDSLQPTGVIISREKFKYEDTSEFKKKEKPYPATLPWFPNSYGGLWSETLASMEHKYPYQAKIMLTYFGNPIYVVPAGHKYIQTLKDPDKLPLHIAFDTTFSETSSLADYIVPDVSYLEGSFGIMNPYPPNLARWMGVRVPVIEPLTAKTSDRRAISTETFIIDVAKKMDSPGYGVKGIDGKYPLNSAEDYHVRAIVNLAFNANVPDASAEEEGFVEQNYPESFVSYARQILTPEEWKKFVYVVARGGVFENPESGFTGETHKYGSKRIFHFWIEKLATTKHSMTGKKFDGTATWLPAKDMAGNDLDELDKAHPFTLVSYKMAIHTQSRTIYQKWALEIVPENYVEMNAKDAERLNLKSGDLVVVRSASDSVQGRVRVTNLVMPGVVAISFHYGHWSHGASDLDVENASDAVGVYTGTRRHHLDTPPESYITGNRVSADSKRSAGIWVNKLMRIDDTTHSPLVDPIAGCSPTSGVRVTIEKLA